MLILLPPSEGKTAARRGKSLDLAALASPSLTATRTTLLEALTTLCRDDPDRAATVLGLGPAQRDLVARNASLESAPTARADAVYTGVLFDALGFATLSPAARRRATSRVAVTSSLFGIVRPGDRIPAYRLSGDAVLPGLGSVAGVWREVLGEAVTTGMGTGLLVDLRSSTYAAFWRPTPDLGRRVATVRVLHESGGRRTVVSHFNKATKGRIVRALLEDGADPRTPKALAEALTRLGWTVEIGDPTPKGTQLDVVVSDIH
ncbi:peroxide stress protein YaaA [Nocardioides hwasunensis]|uniref:Peroxide stress protein YaaA n=1 Tax=Nocardioides hwasunensis TaxID=397258 RepID=A0ABR8MLH3_9ACTN|nr:peroxide stress protein YaaA [Nocardioides hwasunensis]MBD3914914.1 peroxide stress protein YaaA [Nocardioides hwasunensis]